MPSWGLDGDRALPHSILIPSLLRPSVMYKVPCTQGSRRPETLFPYGFPGLRARWGLRVCISGSSGKVVGLLSEATL